MADWKSPMRADPSEWLVLNAGAPLKYRLLTELHSLTVADPNVAKLKAECLAWSLAKQEMRYQRQDGSWGGVALGGDPRKNERSTERTLWWLYELTWDRESKEVRNAAKMLKSFLTHKKEIPLFEFKAQVKQDPLRERHYRWLLKIAALPLLARGGYLEDKVFDAVEELMNNVMSFVSDPVSRRPVEHVGVGLPQLRPEAFREHYVFIPDVYILRTFAHVPMMLDSQRARNILKKIFDYVLSADYQDLGYDIGSIRTARGSIPRSFGIQLRPIEEYTEKGNLEELFYLLEQFARLGLINRYPVLMGYLDWLLGQQQKDGRWDLPQKYFGAKPLYQSWVRLEKDWKSPNRRIADVTFRIMLILRYQWERQIKMLDRGADMYAF
ncbi:MAG: hypothetical protein MUC67_01165 [Acidobacteria bacterium]|jgi:hypothetical protein|nr:hypothetical protein [Acidobacteriota bacterium]